MTSLVHFLLNKKDTTPKKLYLHLFIFLQMHFAYLRVLGDLF